MTKRMTGAVLRSKYQCNFRRGTANYAHSIAESVLMARPSDRFCVVELSAGSGPGSLCKPLDLLRPAIGIVTCIGTDHYSAFGSQDAIAAEKGRLVRELPEDGVAVLNADDPRVIAMRADTRARVVSFGLTAGADVRAESVSATWPDRLSFELVYQHRRIAVQTQLCGTQWVPAALAAAAVGLVMEIPLADIARSLGSVEPYLARMSPLALPDGVTFIRDDWKASMHTIPPALEFLRTARAARKLAVIGTISDYHGSSRTQYVRTARYALEVADLVIFVGPRASVALRARPAHDPDRLRAFSTVRAATEFFSDFLQAGDLVLLKGSNPADHLYRIALSRTSTVSCWRGNCGKGIFCDTCPLVGRGRRTAGPPKGQRASGIAVPARNVAPGTQVLVGLGNPGGKYLNTPHNVGYAVLDRIATETRATWSDTSRAMVADVEWQGIRLYLVKPKTVMNFSGNVLYELFEQSGIDPRQVVLVFDDIDLPLGKVRSRMRGSDGGHLGVRSVLEAFQTDEFRRIKIGVRRAVETGRARDAVLRPFSQAEKPLINAAIDQACSRLQEVVRSDGRDSSPANVSTLPAG
jgi:aminoacyl-tRNA hydrolase